MLVCLKALVARPLINSRIVKVFENIGFMQGRLSPMVEEKIQAFPAQYWRREFAVAQTLGFSLMEWTLDHDGIYENPLMVPEGRDEVRSLMKCFQVSVPSITGDCFMQAPFYKSTGSVRKELLRELDAVIDAIAGVGGRQIVFPLVDSGRLETLGHEQSLFEALNERTIELNRRGILISFEIDFPPNQVKRFISSYPKSSYGINYDIGNSAALGYDPQDEFNAYGDRITNVHVKDRVLNGSTVALGEGNADFATVFSLLARYGYSGNYILQTARAKADDHADVLKRYAEMTSYWIKRASL